MMARLIAYVRGVARRRTIDVDVDDELRFHLEQEIEANAARGMSPAEARRVALRDLGGLTQTREAVRDVRTIWLDLVWRDARHAVRALVATRAALETLGADPDVRFMLGMKERQIADAMHAALGISLTAMAQPAGTPEATGPFNAGPPAMGAVVPGQTFEVRTMFTNRGRIDISLRGSPSRVRRPVRPGRLPVRVPPLRLARRSLWRRRPRRTSRSSGSSR